MMMASKMSKKRERRRRPKEDWWWPAVDGGIGYYYTTSKSYRPSWRRAWVTIVLAALFPSYEYCQHLALAASTAYDLNSYRSSSHDMPKKGTGQGVLIFAHGTERRTTEHFLGEAFVSARRIKALNPSTNITLVTNPDLHPEFEGVFDLVLNIKPEHMLPGEVPSWTPNGLKRQWLTRLEYLGRSPYEDRAPLPLTPIVDHHHLQVTLALDSQALCCSSGVDEIMKQGPREFDIAFAVQGPRVLAPHNWAIMYRLNDSTRRLFNRWRILHIAKSKAGSDQTTLYMAAGSLALQNKLNVGVISEAVALATVPYSRTAPPWPRSSPLVAPGPVHFVHYNAFSQEEEETTCNGLNEDTSSARVVFQPASMPRSVDTNIRTENTWEMKYSEAELAEAAKRVDPDALYFEDLDWNNLQDKWGYTVTAWREHCPHCWDNLYQEINDGIRMLLENPKVRTSPAFAEEFADDRWPT